MKNVFILIMHIQNVFRNVWISILNSFNICLAVTLKCYAGHDRCMLGGWFMVMNDSHHQKVLDYLCDIPTTGQCVKQVCGKCVYISVSYGTGISIKSHRARNRNKKEKQAG